MTTIIPADSAGAYDAGRTLIEEYARLIEEHLCFQRFEEEIASLRSMYGPPEGALLLAWSSGEPVGCVGVRRLDETACEMKRLYVKPEYRGGRLGRRLVDAAVEQAQRLGYGAMRLDTLDTMQSARKLYEAVGFRPIAPYNENPSEHVVHMELEIHGVSYSPGAGS